MVPAPRGPVVDTHTPAVVSNVSDYPRDDRGTEKKTWSKGSPARDGVAEYGGDKVHPAERNNVKARGKGTRNDVWFEASGDNAREGGVGMMNWAERGRRGGDGVNSSEMILQCDGLNMTRNATPGGDAKRGIRRTSSRCEEKGDVLKGKEAGESPVDRPESWQKTDKRHGGTLKDERAPACGLMDEAFRQEGCGGTSVVSANPMKHLSGHVEG